MEELAGLKAGPIVERRCYTSEPIYRAELERIFAKAWLFVAHESELRNPGDFRTTDLAGQPVVAIRGDDGRIRVFLNSCRHRGTIVETEPRGCRKRFRCVYHHWAYDTTGKLTFVPREDAYGADFRKSDHGLVEVPRVDIFDGLVFASLSSDAPALDAYLDTATPFLHEVATYDGRPLEAVGSFEFTYHGNWKLMYENTFDDYHNEYLHARVYQNQPGFQYGLEYTKVKNAAQKGAAVGEAAAGNAAAVRTSPQHLPLKLGRHSCVHWNDAVSKKRTHRINIAIFPSLLGIFHPSLDMTSLRVIKPEGLEKTRVLNYCLAPADASAAEKKAIAERFNAAFGPGGPIMMDDIKVFGLVQDGLKAQAAGDGIVTRGMDKAVGGDADDHAIRAFWDAWREYMLPAEQRAAVRRAYGTN